MQNQNPNSDDYKASIHKKHRCSLNIDAFCTTLGIYINISTTLFKQKPAHIFPNFYLKYNLPTLKKTI